MDEDVTLGRIGGFRLVKRLATGGTSDVLLARAEGPHGFERTVVLKRLLSEHQTDPEFAKMFTREAAAYARLSHPAIVKLFDFFTSDGQLIMVLEYVDGVSLAKLLTHVHQSGQKLDDRASLFIAARIFDALAAAHDARDPDTSNPTPVIHRDVNPSNLLIPWDGHAKLADFGIAKITGTDVEGETKQGLIKGTYGYMAPEQVRGERVTIRTDVYAASLVLWELLARKKAIMADKLPEMEVLRAMAEPKLPSLDALRPDVPEAIREAVARGLEPNPAKRAVTAEEMVALLRAHIDLDDARQRLALVLGQLAPAGRKSLSDTIAEDMRATVEAEAASLPSFDLADAPATSPAPAPPPPRPPVPRPITQSFSPQEPPRPQAPSRGGAAALATTAAALDPVRRNTPSGFRPVSSPPRAVGLSQPTLQGFAPISVVPADTPSDAASTLEIPPKAGAAPGAPPHPFAKTTPSPVRFGETVPLGAKAPPVPSPRAPAAAPARPAPAPPTPATPAPGLPVVAGPAGPPPPAAGPAVASPPPGPAFGPPASAGPFAPAAAGPPFAPPAAPARFAPPVAFGEPPPVLPAAAGRRSGGLVFGIIAGVLVAVGGAAAVGIWFVQHRAEASTVDTSSVAPTAPPAETDHATTATTTVSTAADTAPPLVTTAASHAVATATPTVTAAPSASDTTTVAAAPSPTEGVIDFPSWAKDRRVYLDGHVKGQGDHPLTVRCGEHKVQVGSSGKEKKVNVPCGGTITVD